MVTSTVNGLNFNTKKLGEILGVPIEGFDVYVGKDKSVLWPERLLQLTQELSQQSILTAPRFVKKREMTLMHRLLFWFVIKNVIP